MYERRTKAKERTRIGKELYVLLESNLFLMMTPLKDEKEIGDIEDLFSDEVLNVEIEGKKFTKADEYDINRYYGKDSFQNT